MSTFNSTPNLNPNSLLNNVVPVPTLSTLGFITNSTNKFDKLLSHCFVADYNQTYLYQGSITSIPRLFEIAGTDLALLEQTVKQGLYSYFSKYYENVDVGVTIEEDPEKPNQNYYILYLSFTVTENSVQQTYVRKLATPLKTFSNIIKLNNYGQT